MAPAYRRILLKLSGEALEGQQGYGIEIQTLGQMAEQIKEVRGLGVQVALVIGGDNLFRGLSGVAAGMDRTTADTMTAVPAKTPLCRAIMSSM